MEDYTRAARSGGSVDSPSTEGEEMYLLAGPLGSGKSTVADMIERHYNGSTTAFEMSDYVRNCYYADVGGESIDDNTLGEWAAEKKDGNLGYFGDRLADHLDTDEDTPDAIIVSGIRSPEETYMFKQKWGVNAHTWAVWTLPDIRFKRKYGELAHEEHPKWPDFLDRNERELDEWNCTDFYVEQSVNKADEIIPNNGNLDKLRRVVRGTLAGDSPAYPFPHNDEESIRGYL